VIKPLYACQAVWTTTVIGAAFDHNHSDRHQQVMFVAASDTDNLDPVHVLRWYCSIKKVSFPLQALDDQLLEDRQRMTNRPLAKRHLR